MGKDLIGNPVAGSDDRAASVVFLTVDSRCMECTVHELRLRDGTLKPMFHLVFGPKNLGDALGRYALPLPTVWSLSDGELLELAGRNSPDVVDELSTGLPATNKQWPVR